MTPYRLVTGADYGHPIAMLGEVVLGKVPCPKDKMQRRWIKGLWLGKLGRNDSHILDTTAGAFTVPSARRLPRENQVNKEMMAQMKAIPWQPRDGVQHKIHRELSQPLVLPAPPAAGPTALEEEAGQDEKLNIPRWQSTIWMKMA